MFASVTRLRIRALRYAPAFLWMTFLAQRQVCRARGFLGGRLLVDAQHTFWTLTVWESEQAMKTFRGAGSHAKVIPRLAAWCDEAAYAHWSPENEGIPDWPEAYEHLVSEGRLSRVNYPSLGHQARHFPRPRLKPLVGQDLKPAGTVVPRSSEKRDSASVDADHAA